MKDGKFGLGSAQASSDVAYGHPAPVGYYGAPSAPNEPPYETRVDVGDDDGVVPGYPVWLPQFQDPVDRKSFVKKVYSTLMIQLLVTFGLVFTFLEVDPVRNYVQANGWVWGVSWGISVVMLLCMSCFQSALYTHPNNVIFLSLFTVSFGTSVSAITCFYQATAVLLAIGITLFIVVALTIFAIQTRIDFTTKGMYFLVALLGLMVFGFLLIFFPSNVALVVYASLGAVLFSLYIVFDTQLIMGGKDRQFELGPEDWVLGALSLYLDIMNLFLFILQLLSSRD